MSIAAADIIVRSATNADAPRVQELVFGVLREYGLEPDPETDADISDIEKHYLNRGGVFEVLEDARGKLLGSVGLYPIDSTTVELRKMYFCPQLRGLGLGKKMLERMIAAARAMGYGRIYLETAAVLKTAAALYEKHGFQETTDGMRSCRCDKAYVLTL
jgi:putative acetyltransferase